MAQAQAKTGNGHAAPRVRLSDSARERVKIQTDSLQNLMTGMGGPRDSSLFTKFVLTILDASQLEAAYRSDWMSRKIIDIPAYDSTREWRQWSADKDDIAELEKVEKTFNVKRKTMSAMIKARLYGGGALVLGVDQGKPDQPLQLDKLKKGSLKFIHAVSRYEITAGPLELDIQAPYYGEPQYYDSTGGEIIRLHPSRVVRLVGAELPRLGISDGWGDPVLQSVLDAIMSTGTVMQGVAQLVNESKLDVIRIPDLTAQISSKAYEDRLRKRFGLAADAKSLYNMLLLDKEEEWQRIVTQFAGLPDVIKIFLELVSGAADIPATRFLGQSPRGLNATGISDIRNYYDRIASDQGSIVTPAVERMDEVIIRAALGARPEDIFYTWKPLWQADKKEEADITLAKAQAHKIDVDAQLIDPVVLKQARENQLIEDGTYPGLETILDDFNAQQEEAGIDPNAPPEPTDPSLAPNDPNNPDNQPNVDPNNPAQPTPPGPANAKKPKTQKPPATQDAIKEMTARARKVKTKLTQDAAPRTLYVYRPVTNAQDIIDWFKGQGFETTLPASDMHVTIAYSDAPVDWMKAGEAWGTDDKGNLAIKPGGVRIIDKFGNAVVLAFASSELSWRWCAIKENTGAEWKWQDYQPHITLSYNGAPADLSTVKPYKGPILLGPEVFEEVKQDWNESVVEDAMWA